MLTFTEKQEIETARRELEGKYPIEANYESRCSLWSEGLKDGVVTKELYNKAREYYDRLWNYTGD